MRRVLVLPAAVARVSRGHGQLPILADNASDCQATVHLPRRTRRPIKPASPQASSAVTV